MTHPTQALLERLESLMARATPRPWYTLDAPWLPSGTETSILAGSPDPHVATFICDFDTWALDDDDDRKGQNPDEDAALLVAAVNTLPTPISRIRELDTEVERLRYRCEEIASESATKAEDIYIGEVMANRAKDEIIKGLEAALRIELWNSGKGGPDQDGRIRYVEDRVAAIRGEAG